jgi:hypothetical protein
MVLCELFYTNHPMILSHFQTAPMLAARKRGDSQIMVSDDLGVSTKPAHLDDAGVLFADGVFLSWELANEIDANPSACFRIHDNAANPVRIYSEEFGRSYALLPTQSAPALTISGVLMHRVQGIDPLDAAAAMVASIVPQRGQVLDTATGLGYTAIEAAKTADHVVTIELDPAVQEIARSNPWSRALFDNPKIEMRTGDSFEIIDQFADGTFSRIIHDPPVFGLAGELYSGLFYRKAMRVLAPRGRMFHYIGDPKSKSGARVTKGVVERLRDAGFSRVEPAPMLFGVVAYF